MLFLVPCLSLAQNAPRPTSTPNINSANAVAASISAEYLFLNTGDNFAHDTLAASTSGHNLTWQAGSASTPVWLTTGTGGVDVTNGWFLSTGSSSSFLRTQIGTTGFAWELRFQRTGANGSFNGNLMFSGSNYNQIGFRYSSGTNAFTYYNGTNDKSKSFFAADTSEHDLVYSVGADGSSNLYYDGGLQTTGAAADVAATIAYDSSGFQFGNGLLGKLVLARQFSRTLTQTEITALSASPYGTTASPFYAAAAATGYSVVTGPTQGANNTNSSVFTVTPNGPATDTLTLSATGGGTFYAADGTTVITSLTWSASSTAKTFIYKPASTGDKTISFASSSLTAPASVPYASVSVTSSPSGTVASVSDNASLVITPTVSGGAASSTAITLAVSGGGTLSTLAGGASITSGVSGAAFYYNAPASGSGTATVSITHVSGASTVLSIPFAPGVSVTLDQANQTVNQGAAVTVNATVTGSATTTVTWSGTALAYVSGSANQRTFTAPTTAGTYTLTATSVADGTKTVSIVFTVPAVTISLVSPPSPVALSLSGTVTFLATVAGTTSTGVTYSTSGGTINSGTGVYTAPTSPGTYSVTATSTADNTKTVVWTINVTATTSFPVSINFGSAIGSGQTVFVTVLNVAGSVVVGRTSSGAIDFGSGNYGFLLTTSTSYMGYVKYDVTVSGTTYTTTVAAIAPTVFGATTYPASVNFGSTIGGGQTVGYTVYTSAGGISQARSTASVVDLGSGVYGVSLSVAANFAGYVKWDTTVAGTNYVAASTTFAPKSSTSAIRPIKGGPVHK